MPLPDLDFKHEIKSDIIPVVIAEKSCHKGAMFGHVSNGGGIVDLGNGKSLKFIATNEKYVTLQLLETGLGSCVKTQSWQKSKKIIVKKDKPTFEPKFNDKVEER